MPALPFRRREVAPPPAAPDPVPRDPAALAAEEQRCIAAIRQGDERAFAALVHQYAARLYDLARTYVNGREDAEDLVQEVFCRIWERHASWEVSHGVTVYLYQSVRNAATNRYRRRAVALRHAVWTRADENHEASVAHIGMAQARPTPDQRVEREELRVAVDMAISQLPERCRDVYVLRWKHHLPHAEIAAVMGISVKAVEAQLTRGAHRLRLSLARFWP